MPKPMLLTSMGVFYQQPSLNNGFQPPFLHFCLLNISPQSRAGETESREVVGAGGTSGGQSSAGTQSSMFTVLLASLDAFTTRNKTKVSGVEEVCCLYIRGWRQRGPQMGYLRASVQRLCGSPLFLSPPRTAAALLYDSRQSHKYKKKKATSPHI